MLTSRYLNTTKNLQSIMQSIVKGTAPEKFSVDHLKGLGFKSSNDRAFIPLLKDLQFLNLDGKPLQRYHDYRDPSRSRVVLGDALKEAYGDLFVINAKPSKVDREAIEGKFKTVHNVGDRVAQLQAMTFLGLLELSDITSTSAPTPLVPQEAVTADNSQEDAMTERPPAPRPSGMPSLHYSIEVHLPPSKDVEVYNAIFRSLKENLLD